MLTKKDLENIKDLVEFTVTQSERRLESRFDGIDDRIDGLEKEILDFKSEIHREITDIAETNREFLDTLGSHEDRIERLELKTGVVAD